MEKRNKKAVVTLIIGLVLNIALGASKLAAGIISRSASVTSDSLNNLSDSAVVVVTIIATVLAARRADHDHPFGHGRYEYIATFVVSAAILAVGIEAFISGIERAITPVAVEFGIVVWATLAVSVAVKAFMAVFYFVRARSVGADTLRAAAFDSVSDAAVTSVVLCCAVAEKYTGAHIDGYASIAVAVVIAVFAFKLLKQTVSRLLGERPDTALYGTVRDIIMSHDGVVSVHDIIINDYGAATKIAEADAEFPSDMSFIAVHTVCDAIERDVYDKTGIRLSVHADPISVEDKRLMDLTERIGGVLRAYGASAHDISIDDKAERVELDICLTEDNAPESEITAQVKAAVGTVLPYAVVINVDYI